VRSLIVRQSEALCRLCRPSCSPVIARSCAHSFPVSISRCPAVLSLSTVGPLLCMTRGIEPYVSIKALLPDAWLPANFQQLLPALIVGAPIAELVTLLERQFLWCPLQDARNKNPTPHIADGEKNRCDGQTGPLTAFLCQAQVRLHGTIHKTQRRAAATVA
jgi:hypothetical protein